MRTHHHLGLFRCPSCGTAYNPTYGPCPNCKSRAHCSHPSYRSYLLPLLLLTLLWLSGSPLGAKPALAQTRPMTVQALGGTTYIDLNANGRRDYGEPAQSEIIVQARHIDSEITVTWESTSDHIGSYRLLLWDPGSYDLAAYCTTTDDAFSSIYICWRSTSPLVIAGAGHTLDIPVPAQHLYLPIVRK